MRQWMIESYTNEQREIQSVQWWYLMSLRVDWKARTLCTTANIQKILSRFGFDLHTLMARKGLNPHGIQCCSGTRPVWKQYIPCTYVAVIVHVAVGAQYTTHTHIYIYVIFTNMLTYILFLFSFAFLRMCQYVMYATLHSAGDVNIYVKICFTLL